MNRRKALIGAILVIIGLPILSVSALYVFFYSVFYFPNRTTAVTRTIVSRVSSGSTCCMSQRATTQRNRCHWSLPCIPRCHGRPLQ